MSGRILIVEAVPTQRIALRALLEGARYGVEHCSTVAAARCLLAQGLRPDLILLRTSAGDLPDDLGAGAHPMADRGRISRVVAGPDVTLPLAQVIADLKLGGQHPGVAWTPARQAIARGPAPIVVAIDDGGAPHTGQGRDADAMRLRALRAGADDVICRPLPEPLLLARIRSLLRNRAETEDLRPRSAAIFAEGFAEIATSFAAPQRIVVITPLSGGHRSDAGLPIGLAPALSGLVARDPARFEIHGPWGDIEPARGSESSSWDGTGNRLADPRERTTTVPVPYLAETPTAMAPSGGPPDLIVLDPCIGAPGGMLPGEILRTIADLRSRSPLRQAAQLLVVPSDHADLAALALDLGVDDVVSDTVGPGELSYRIETLLRQKKVADGLRASVQRGLEAAVIDPLTGLHNRRFAMPHLEMLVQDAGHRMRPFALMMLDIDHFKQINDTYGHATGDCVLRAVARRLKDELGPRDMIARIGGEEFLVVLPETTEAGARDVAERLRQSIAARPFDGNDPDCARPQPARSRIDVTLSVGVALGGIGHPRDADALCLYDRADRALFGAKEAGRNTVTLSASAA